ncbi:MAG: 4-alpha-glucanotransferase [Chloroflexi bacterium 44-23]|nr:MAG: 4-alpha-glucanotransferase [Chloroflexi bacterium 44-23]
MKSKRLSGILLHPSSLPSPDGIGDLGPEAYRWISFLKETGSSLWQVLPLGPTGYGDSPYQSFSAFAGNPYLISATLLIEDNLLTVEELQERPVFNENCVDFGPVIQWKLKVLHKAYLNFKMSKNGTLLAEFEQFQQQEADWLKDFALFMSLKEAFGGNSWETWDIKYRSRNPQVIEEFEQSNFNKIQEHVFKQFIFFRQWNNLKSFANLNGIRVIGDIPIFVSFDSSDSWSHPELFYFSQNLKPTVVAGVPPDYFSATGQLWGNPLYRWDVHKSTDYKWWFKRLKATLKLFDIIRLDHFRGFIDYWEIPAGNPTAEIGRWMPGPGADFFEKLRTELGELPIIAEDLGQVNPKVFDLRDQFGLPGMKILQFAFSGDPNDPFLPHNYPENCVAYSGTHDNDTALGWYESAPPAEKDFYRRYLARSGKDVSWDLIRAVWSSVAATAIAPLQDFLSLGTEARMNFPGKPSGNWSWRVNSNQLSDQLSEKILELNYLYGRKNSNNSDSIDQE